MGILYALSTAHAENNAGEQLILNTNSKRNSETMLWQHVAAIFTATCALRENSRAARGEGVTPL